MAVRSLRGLVMPRCDEYELRVLQEAAVGGCNGGRGGYNVGGYYGGGGYNVGGYAMVVWQRPT